MDRKELEEMLDGVKGQGYGVDQPTLIAVLESHIALHAKFDRVTSCR